MKILVVGCNGQLGEALARTAPATAQVVGKDLPDLDISDASAVAALCKQLLPDVIVNAAAYTAVDRAETDQALAEAVNALGPRNIGSAGREIGARVVHISTDFVFDGKSQRPYRSEAPTNPLSVYGRTKRDGELEVLDATAGSAVIIRTSWLYSKTGSNFVKTMLRLMKERDEIGVVSDQVGTPTWADSLAGAVWAFIDKPTCRGIFHWSDDGHASWYEFAVAIQEEALSLGLLQKAIRIRPIRTEDYPTAATRPAYSVLDCRDTHKAINRRPVAWRANLHQMLQGLTE